MYKHTNIHTHIQEEKGCTSKCADSEIVLVDLAFWDDLFEQDRSWDDFGTTIAGM